MTHDDHLSYYKAILVNIIAAHLPNCTIYLFGSRARKTNREGADIDVALDNAGSTIEWRKMNEMRSDIDDSPLPVLVDLVDFNAASEHMQQAIKEDRILWKN